MTVPAAARSLVVGAYLTGLTVHGGLTGTGALLVAALLAVWSVPVLRGRRRRPRPASRARPPGARAARPALWAPPRRPAGPAR